MTEASSTLHHDVGNRDTEDQFNRKPFALRLAQTIAGRRDTASFVIGLYGAWGEGKSTVLDYMADHLAQAGSGVVLVRFNPWLFGNDEALTAALITSIAEELGAKLGNQTERALQVVQLLARYGGKLAKTVGAATGQGWVEKGGEFVEGLADGRAPREPTTEQLKARISAELLAANQRVVVLLDDIDRLTREEIQRVFRLIKVAADFPTVTYVLAFDPEMVAAAVAAQYGAGDPQDGRRFLEKMVQLPLNLPHLDGPSMTHYTSVLLAETLTEANVSLDERQQERFLDALHTDIMPAIRTPRQAKRYANAVAFALPILRGETEPVDVMLVEALRVLYPATFHVIREDPDAFLHPSGVPTVDLAQFSAHLKELLDGHPPAAVKLVRRLFPAVDLALQPSTTALLSDSQRPRRRSAYQTRYFPRYFQYAIPDNDVPDSEIEAFADMAVKDPVAADQWLRELAGGPRAGKFLSGLHDLVPELPTTKQSPIILALVRGINVWPPRLTNSFLLDPRLEVNAMVGKAAIAAGAEDARRLLEEIIDSGQYPYAIRLLYYLERLVPLHAFDANLEDDLRQRLVEHLEAHGDRLAIVLNEDYLRGLQLISRVHGLERTEANLLQHLRSGRDALVEFLAARAPRQGALYAPNEFDAQGLKSLTQVISVEALVNLLQDHFPVGNNLPITTDVFSDNDIYTSNAEEAAQSIANRIRLLHLKAVAESWALDDEAPVEEDRP